jgi:hypothetical protein
MQNLIDLVDVVIPIVSDGFVEFYEGLGRLKVWDNVSQEEFKHACDSSTFIFQFIEDDNSLIYKFLRSVVYIQAGKLFRVLGHIIVIDTHDIHQFDCGFDLMYFEDV